MIVLDMLREHPLVHVMDVQADIMADGRAILSDWRNPDTPDTELAMTRVPLNMLAYGAETVPESLEAWVAENYEDVPELGFRLDTFLGGRQYPSRGEFDTKVAKTPQGFFFFRRDGDTYDGMNERWAYHLFFTPHRGGRDLSWVPPFWEHPPIAKILPLKDALKRVWKKEGLDMRLVRVKPRPDTCK